MYIFICVICVSLSLSLYVYIYIYVYKNSDETVKRSDQRHNSARAQLCWIAASATIRSSDSAQRLSVLNYRLVYSSNRFIKSSCQTVYDF